MLCSLLTVSRHISTVLYLVLNESTEQHVGLDMTYDMYYNTLVNQHGEWYLHANASRCKALIHIPAQMYCSGMGGMGQQKFVFCCMYMLACLFWPCPTRPGWYLSSRFSVWPLLQMVILVAPHFYWKSVLPLLTSNSELDSIMNKHLCMINIRCIWTA